MMKDMDGLSHHINPLIYHYLVQAYHMRANDNVKRLFTCCHDTFTTCSNPHCIVASDTTVFTKLSSLLSPLSIVHCSSINFTSTPTLQSCSTLLPNPLVFHHIVPPKDIIWLSFDSVTTSLESLLSRWSGGSVRRYMFETNLQHHHLSFSYHHLHNLSIQHFHIYFTT